MIAADTSSVSAYLAGEDGSDIELLDAHILSKTLVLPDVVVTELFSARGLTPETRSFLSGIPRMPITSGYWERAGDARRLLRAQGLRARLGDALIAQACIDAGVALITRDRDFRHYETHCGLQLA